jgi:protein-tyrosine phosphatase
VVLTTSALGRLANFRDLGGYATRSGRVIRPGLVFRCGSMHLWTVEEIESVRTHLGPKTLIDLRHQIEGERFPVPVDDIGARCVNIPFSRRSPDGDQPPVLPTLAETYIALARLSWDSISTLLATLADPDNLPAIVFCAAGKDRTGVATALLLGALNVEERQIVEDYALSGVIDPRALGDLYVQHMAEMPDSYQGSDPENMRTFLAEIRREHGSIRAFVAGLGFGPERIVELERALLTSEVVDQPMRPVT